LQAQSYTDLLPLNDPAMYVAPVPAEKKTARSPKDSSKRPTAEQMAPPTHRSQSERPVIFNALALLVYIASGVSHLGLIRTTVQCSERIGSPVEPANCTPN